MLNIASGTAGVFCDSIPRRSFLQIGSLGMGGLALPELLRAEASAGSSSSSHKAVIMVFLPGGPPHLDMYDPKPDAPSTVRGEFDPISTNVPGIQVSELMPRQAEIMDKLAIVRSVVGTADEHSAFHCLTGWASKGFQPAGGWPSLGAVVSKVQGSTQPGVPPFVGLAREMNTRALSDSGAPGFLGLAHGPFKVNKGGVHADMVLHGITTRRLDDRRTLLKRFDRFRRGVDASGTLDSLDAFQRQALGILTSNRLLEALDLSREDPAVRERYGKAGGYYRFRPDVTEKPGGAGALEDFLVARRLVEAGVRCVTLNFGKWDWHEFNFRQAKSNVPRLDQGVTALVQDLHERGLHKDVTVVIWGEFGRTPRINKLSGRDHWPQVMSVVLAGGGLRTGQVVGATNRLGERSIEEPVQFQRVFATLYHQLGIRPERLCMNDRDGRPHYLLNHHEPIRQLL